MAPVPDMVAHIGDPRVQVLEEKEEGHFVFYRTAAAGLGALVIAALGFLILARERPEPAF